MKSQLSLRQHKIIRLLRDSKTYVTSEEISEKLSVSSKTVRNDIADINSALASEGICIDSIRSKGFILKSEDKEALKKYSKDVNLFLGRSDRIYYIAVRLCTTTDPVDVYDLEDEVAVSSSTLAGDIAGFKSRFAQGAPYIEVYNEKNFISVENNEFKRRFILTKLLSDNWDYNSTGNVYYKSDFIDNDVFNIINANVCDILYLNNIHLEDYYLISLNLYLSIAYHRIKGGYYIEPHDSNIVPSESTVKACEELFAILGEKLSFSYPGTEVTEICQYIEEKRIPRGRDIFENRTRFASSDVNAPIVSEYLQKVYDTFGIDLRADKDLCNLLMKYIERIGFPLRDLTVRQPSDVLKQTYFAEFEAASLFAETAASYGITLYEDDILYLTPAISGAIVRVFYSCPEKRIKTVLMSHLGITDMWSLSIKIKAYFDRLIELIDVIPVNHKNQFDFSQCEMIITTVNKQITAYKDLPVVQISPNFTEDDKHLIDTQITQFIRKSWYPKEIIPLSALLKDAFVHEKQLFLSRFDLIEFMAEDFLEAGIFTEEHVMNILKRESVASFASSAPVLVLYSSLPARETKLSVCTLDHRIVWNSHKIRTVFMLSLTKDDMNEIFYVMNEVYHQQSQPDVVKRIKTKKELDEFYK